MILLNIIFYCGFFKDFMLFIRLRKLIWKSKIIMFLLKIMYINESNISDIWSLDSLGILVLGNILGLGEIRCYC